MSLKDTKFDISNKVAVITGAAGLLGIKHADALLEIGATVYLTDVNTESLNDAKNLLLEKGYSNKRINTLEMDVSKEPEVVNALNIIQSENNVDILINNAAINPTVSSIENNVRTTRLENFSIDRWNLELQVGLTGAFLCSKFFGNHMARNNGGVILNIASDLSVIAPDQRIYHQESLPDHLQAVKPITYSVIKHGLIGLTKYLSSYWPEKGVRANALSPGGIYVDQDDEFVKKISDLIPFGRMADPDEYIGAIQFLCSDASKYMNGHNLIIDGGRSII
tara:strand:- start:69 stop:905 length:837 start_codon:yes stop_codon:yes gene_type:complete